MKMKQVIMDNKNFTTAILVDKTPKEVFKVINNVRAQMDLTSDYECYNVCQDAWTSYIQRV